MYKIVILFFLTFFVIRCGVATFPTPQTLLLIEGGKNRTQPPTKLDPKNDLDSDGVANNIDVDSDNDRLIEIKSLAVLYSIHDDLNADGIDDGVIHNVHAVGNLGCPDQGCIGYELITDLNFDENNDNFENDSYNQGYGFPPIGRCNIGTVDNLQSFQGRFEGNGYKINNIVIGPRSLYGPSNCIGLFGRTSRSAIINGLTLSGRVIANSNDQNVGGLVGYNLGIIKNVLVSMTFTSTSLNGNTGVIVGNNAGKIENVISAGEYTWGVAPTNISSIGLIIGTGSTVADEDPMRPPSLNSAYSIVRAPTGNLGCQGTMNTFPVAPIASTGNITNCYIDNMVSRQTAAVLAPAGVTYQGLQVLSLPNFMPTTWAFADAQFPSLIFNTIETNGLVKKKNCRPTLSADAMPVVSIVCQ